MNGTISDVSYKIVGELITGGWCDAYTMYRGSTLTQARAKKTELERTFPANWANWAGEFKIEKYTTYVEVIE